MAVKKHDLSVLKEIRCQWPAVPTEVLPEDKRKLFEQRKIAVDLYIDGVNVSEIMDRTHIDRRNISRYVDKCISIDENGEYYGYWCAPRQLDI